MKIEELKERIRKGLAFWEKATGETKKKAMQKNSKKRRMTMVQISKMCNTCNKKKSFDVTEKQLHKYKSGALIQDFFPEFSDDDRELLLSGMCGKCFDKLFKEDYI